MSKILTRYNAFIPDKPGFFSCPSCYLAMKSAAKPELQCPHCGTKAPIFTPTPHGVTVFVTGSPNLADVQFHITAASASHAVYTCPKCAYGNALTSGLYTASCINCGFAASVSYREICNACLMNHPFVLKAAEYLCSDPKRHHTAGHNSHLAVAGKCGGHRCQATCKKI